VVFHGFFCAIKQGYFEQALQGNDKYFLSFAPGHLEFSGNHLDYHEGDRARDDLLLLPWRVKASNRPLSVVGLIASKSRADTMNEQITD
jgi:hypothetical protein